MPRKKTQKFYFGDEQEEAVKQYLKTESEEEKNKIFNEYLRQPLITMSESIIRRYKLYRKDIEFQEIQDDTISFLITKIDKFNPEKNHKAYSYFGTICKNYLMGTRQKESKEFNRKISYEDISSNLDENEKYSYRIDDYGLDFNEIIAKLTYKLENFMEKENLTENERKLGYALIEIFNNFEIIFQIGEGNKFNKNLILLSIREMTSLSTKEIRVSMKRFKKIYKGVLKDFLD